MTEKKLEQDLVVFSWIRPDVPDTFLLQVKGPPAAATPTTRLSVPSSRLHALKRLGKDK
jgi:hypothetical protein